VQNGEIEPARQGVECDESRKAYERIQGSCIPKKSQKIIHHDRDDQDFKKRAQNVGKL